MARKHRHGWEGAAPESDVAWRDCPGVGAASELFIFIYFFSRIRADSARFTSNRADSARVELYRPYRVVLTGDRNSRNRPKSALNLAGTAKIPTLEA